MSVLNLDGTKSQKPGKLQFLRELWREVPAFVLMVIFMAAAFAYVLIFH